MNPTTDTDDIYTTCEAVLATVNEVFSEAGVELPTRQFLYAGSEYPHECEQVNVGFLQHYSGTPGNQAQEPTKCSAPRTVVLAVEVVRDCSPTLEAPRSGSTGRERTPRRTSMPSVESLNADAKRKMADARLLMEAGMRCGEFGIIPAGAMADVSAGEVQGNFQGMVLNLIIEVS